MILTKKGLVQGWGVGILISCIGQTLLVLWLPDLMTYVGTTIIVMALIFYPLGIFLIIASIRMKGDTVV